MKRATEQVEAEPLPSEQLLELLDMDGEDALSAASGGSWAYPDVLLQEISEHLDEFETVTCNYRRLQVIFLALEFYLEQIREYGLDGDGRPLDAPCRCEQDDTPEPVASHSVEK